MSEKLANRVQAVNETNDFAYKVYTILVPLLTPFIGKKVIEENGELLESVKESLNVFLAVIQSFSVNESALEAAMSAELYATYDAFRAVKQGVPFREAYRETAEKTLKGKLDVKSLKEDWKLVRDAQLKSLEQANEELLTLQKTFIVEEENLAQVARKLFNLL